MVRMGVPPEFCNRCRGDTPARLSGKLWVGALRSVTAARKANAVVDGADAKLALDDATQVLFADESHHRRNALQWQVGLFESATRRLKPDQLHRLGGRSPGLGHIGTRKRAWAHARRRGEALDAQVLVEMLSDPAMERREGRAGLRLQRERGAELRLPAGALHEHHQLPRSGDGGPVAEVVLDERKSKVDAGGDAV